MQYKYQNICRKKAGQKAGPKPEQDSAPLLDGSCTLSVQPFFNFGSAGGKKCIKNDYKAGQDALDRVLG
jgi:hypothetical protein